MADLTVDALGELASPAANDEIGIWDVSAGQYLKIQRSVLVGGVITGAGTIATGGFTLTVPATGTAALLGTAQSFTKPVTIAPTVTSEKALTLNAPTSTIVDALDIQYNGTTRVKITASGTLSQIAIDPYDNGATTGGRLFLDRNNNASTPAAGCIGMRDKGNQAYWLWPDDSGVVRIDTSAPTNAGDGGGSVLGAQTSHGDFKDITGAPVSDATALQFICEAAAQVARFVYKSGAYNSQEFSGVVLDGADLARYGMDADGDHAAGKSLNVINAIGDLFLAVRGLSARVAQLEAQCQ